MEHTRRVRVFGLIGFGRSEPVVNPARRAVGNYVAAGRGVEISGELRRRRRTVEGEGKD